MDVNQSDRDHQTPRDNRTVRAAGVLLAGAVGDALGWPFEDRAARTPNPRRTVAQESFFEWRRRAEFPSRAHFEQVRAGEYSDDTQLSLATGRSLLRAGDCWWEYFTRVELPLWLTHERGGGRQTKKAARSWMSATPPWSDSRAEVRKAYWDAGGNGAVMRVAPHSIVSEARTGSSRLDALLNGLATHGHPRALIPSLVYSQVLSMLLSKSGTLAYKELVAHALDSSENWASVPQVDDLLPDWSDTRNSSYQYDAVWQETAREMTLGLQNLLERLDRGAFLSDQEIMGEIGCFDRKIRGSGVIATLAALYLSSRYATNPMAGIRSAAFASGADTDTIASLTGGLLGALHGPELVGILGKEVQDAEYISSMAISLASLGQIEVDQGEWAPQRLNKSDLDIFTGRVFAAAIGESLGLPDGRKGRLTEVIVHETRVDSLEAMSYRLDVDDGQSIWLKRVKKVTQSAGSVTSEHVRPQETIRRTDHLSPQSVAVLVEVNDLPKMRTFYRDVVGITELRASVDRVIFESLVLVARETRDAKPTTTPSRSHADASLQSNKGIGLFVKVDDLEALYQRLLETGLVKLGSKYSREGQWEFKARDPEQNVILFSQRVRP